MLSQVQLRCLCNRAVPPAARSLPPAVNGEPAHEPFSAECICAAQRRIHEDDTTE